MSNHLAPIIISESTYSSKRLMGIIVFVEDEQVVGEYADDI